MSKKVAVLIPTYQPKEYLERCLKAIENQSLDKEHFRVYIGLNGPKEHYEAFVLKVLEQITFQFKYIYIEEAGVSNARNALLDTSTEEFVAFVDDDDVISENYLKNLLEVSTDKYLGISKIYNFQYDIHTLTQNNVGTSYEALADSEYSIYRARKYFSSPWGKVLSRDMIGKIRFDTNLSLGEDGLFMAMISNNITGLKKTKTEAVYYVYERESSTSRKRRSMGEKVKISLYLVQKYILLLFGRGYNRLFILSRIAATMSALKSQIIGNGIGK
jgi:glycosyltransferase involved in cell wall biosynthesis